jgi:putative protease
MNRIELLAPAGSPEALDAAIGEGADAVYLGLRDFNARARAKNFAYRQFECAVERLHSMKRKVYVTLNTVIEEHETSRLYNFLKYLSAVAPDGLIVQDMGVAAMANAFFPDLRLHCSTQMNVSSSEGVNFWSRQNFKRVVLSRELDLQQLKEIRQNTSAQLEVFCHGALCVSLSGACLFSSYFGGKSANRGRCTQACRRLYANVANPADKKFFFSLNDLQLIGHIPELEEAGINSLKIEGRMKSHQYIASVVRAYRTMIDEYPNDKEAAFEKAAAILQNDFARNKTEFLFTNRANYDIISPEKSGQTGIALGTIQDVKSSNGSATITLTKNIELQPGDHLRIQAENDSTRETYKVTEAENKKITLRITEEKPLPNEGDRVFLVSRQDFDKPYEKIIGADLDKYRHHPGITPVPALQPNMPKSQLKLKDGVFVKVEKAADIYPLQTQKPDYLVFPVTPHNFDEFLSTLAKTQFKPDDVIVYMQPYFDENTCNFWKDAAVKLAERGFNKFMANNYGQLNLLRSLPVERIAGPYLYVFNSFAANFLSAQDVRNFVSPLENNKRNLYQTQEHIKNQNIIVPVFAYPELFQIISRLDKHFHHKFLKDVQTGYEFSVEYAKDRIAVLPEKPFSITDKINDLKKRGFKKFFVDLSGMKISKGLYREILQHVNESRHMEQTCRFNWKDGFYFDKPEDSKTDKK